MDGTRLTSCNMVILTPKQVTKHRPPGKPTSAAGPPRSLRFLMRGSLRRSEHLYVGRSSSSRFAYAPKRFSSTFLFRSTPDDPGPLRETRAEDCFAPLVLGGPVLGEISTHGRSLEALRVVGGSISFAARLRDKVTTASIVSKFSNGETRRGKRMIHHLKRPSSLFFLQ